MNILSIPDVDAGNDLEFFTFIDTNLFLKGYWIEKVMF